MLGAIIGDIVGSAYEFHNTKTKNFELFSDVSRPTDDSMMTIAVAETLINNYPINYNKIGLEKIKQDLINNFVKWFKVNPNAGYSEQTSSWLKGNNNYQPYNSFGDGAGMRVSPVGFIANSIKEVKLLSKIVTEITHNHPEGLKAAEAISMLIYFARISKTKEEMKEYVVNNYYPRLKDLNYEDLVKTYTFSGNAMDTIPEAIYAFLISNDFEDCLRTAISIGGDSDTIADMACVMAEAYYKEIPLQIKRNALLRLSSDSIKIIGQFYQIINLKSK